MFFYLLNTWTIFHMIILELLKYFEPLNQWFKKWNPWTLRSLRNHWNGQCQVKDSQEIWLPSDSLNRGFNILVQLVAICSSVTYVNNQQFFDVIDSPPFAKPTSRNYIKFLFLKWHYILFYFIGYSKYFYRGIVFGARVASPNITNVLQWKLTFSSF